VSTDYAVRLIVGVEVRHSEVWESRLEKTCDHNFSQATLYHPTTGERLWESWSAPKAPFYDWDYNNPKGLKFEGEAGVLVAGVSAGVFRVPSSTTPSWVLGIQLAEVDAVHSSWGSIAPSTVEQAVREMGTILRVISKTTPPIPQLYYIPEVG
jgi:hypothetical protein